VSPLSDAVLLTPVKPLSRRERRFARKHHLFLLRNIHRVRAARERLSCPASVPDHHDPVKSLHTGTSSYRYRPDLFTYSYFSVFSTTPINATMSR